MSIRLYQCHTGKWGTSRMLLRTTFVFNFSDCSEQRRYNSECRWCQMTSVELYTLYDWIKINTFVLNISKTKPSVFGSQHSLISKSKLDFFLPVYNHIYFKWFKTGCNWNRKASHGSLSLATLFSCSIIVHFRHKQLTAPDPPGMSLLCFPELTKKTVYGAKLSWNNLPLDIHLIKNKSTLKKWHKFSVNLMDTMMSPSSALVHINPTMRSILDLSHGLRRDMNGTLLEDIINSLSVLSRLMDVRMDPEKVQAVQNWKTSFTPKEVQHFLGFAHFYTNFIRNFGSIAAL